MHLSFDYKSSKHTKNACARACKRLVPWSFSPEGHPYTNHQLRSTSQFSFLERRRIGRSAPVSHITAKTEIYAVTNVAQQAQGETGNALQQALSVIACCNALPMNSASEGQQWAFGTPQQCPCPDMPNMGRIFDFFAVARLAQLQADPAPTSLQVPCKMKGN